MRVAGGNLTVETPANRPTFSVVEGASARMRPDEMEQQPKGVAALGQARCTFPQ
jgi:hypothetical protein